MTKDVELGYDANDSTIVSDDHQGGNTSPSTTDRRDHEGIAGESNGRTFTEDGCIEPTIRPDQKHPNQKQEEETEIPPRSFLGACFEGSKYLFSSVLLLFSVAVVMAAIFTRQTIGTDKNETNIHPAAAFAIFWFLICWLAMMEGGQGCLVGLQPIDKDLYAESHPRALKNTVLAHKGDNMERFIVGRQFLVVLVVFVSNLMSSATDDANVFGLPDWASEAFLASGLALILTTVMLGQLTAQVNAANCMLDFINNYFMLFTVWVSLAIEFSGLLHCVYLVQIFFSKIAGKPVDSEEPPRNTAQKVFFWGRVVISFIILGFAFVVTLTALFDGNTNMWEGIPPYVAVIVFFALMSFAGILDGMQIALFAVVNMPEEELKKHSIAHANCQLTFAGQNLQAFLIGRQICVTICTFVVARITTLDYGGDDKNIFGVNDGLQNFFNTGLLSAVTTTVVASLAWRVIASSFPVAFLSNPLIYAIIRLCLLLEASGVCSASWVLAHVHKVLIGYQPDAVYLEEGDEKNTYTVELATLHDEDVSRIRSPICSVVSTDGSADLTDQESLQVPSSDSQSPTQSMHEC